MNCELSKIATIGFFDGVHKGHRYLFKQLDGIAAERGLVPLIVTFEQHPRTVLQSDYLPQLLTTTDERRVLLSAYGEVLMLPFAEIQSLTAAEFMEQLHKRYGVTVLIMGYDHRFGSDRLRRPQDYRRIGAQHGIEVLTMTEFTDGEWHVSSSEIRAALESGNIALANELLGRPYALRGTVVHGKGLGRTIGFPTANIQPLSNQTIVPKPGVYEVEVQGEGVQAKGMCNIDTNRTIEVHIPSFQGDLYGDTLKVRFMRFLREEKQISRLEDLQQQLIEDLKTIQS